jgi:hypothetical protein
MSIFRRNWDNDWLQSMIWNKMWRGATVYMKLRSTIVLSVSVVVVFVVGAFAFLRQQNLTVLDRAEHILGEANQLRVEESSFAEVLQFARKFDGEERSNAPNGSCTPSDCLVTVYALPPDSISRHPALIKATDQIGIHLFHVHVSLWVKDGKLTDIEEVFLAPKEFGGLMVRSTTSRPPADACKYPSYQLHPAYMTSLRKRQADEFEYWTSTGKQPLPRMNLSCVGSVRGCTGVAQILPQEWAQHEADEKRIKAGEDLAGDALCAK